MRLWKRLLLAAVVVIAICYGWLLIQFLQLSSLKPGGKEVPQTAVQTASETAEPVDPQIIRINMDGDVPENGEPGSLYLEGDQLRIPAEWLNDYFGCDVYVLRPGTIRISGAGGEAELTADEEGRVSAEEAAVALGFSYSWDGKACEAKIGTPESSSPEYPAQYDLREEGRVSPVKDQAQQTTCWAFAALSAVESALLPEVDLQLSADHLNEHHGFQTEGNGGDFNMALAYLVSWKGPVTEEEDPYGDGESPDDLTAAVHVQDAVILTDDMDTSRLKALIMENGAIESAIYAMQDPEAMSDLYNSETSAYYYSGSEICNHDIDIIGWDDDFPKEYFPEEPPGDGALLCKNSWGEEFGSGGFFYISYYDSNIGKYGVSYSGVESADNYDHLYQYDQLGWTGAVGYGKPDALLAAAYTAESAQNLAAAGFYSTDPRTWYDIYLVHDFAGTEDFTGAQYLRSGYLPDRGYFTVELGEEIPLKKGEKFAIAVRIRTEGAEHPVAMEFAGNELTSAAQSDDGETYMSPNGSIWTSVEEAADGNVCLKAYTRDK